MNSSCLKFLFLKSAFALFACVILFTATNASAQKLPIIVGGTIETGTGVMADDEQGTGIVRITPQIGAWIMGLGYFRVGYGLYNFTVHPDEDEKETVRHRDISLQLGIALGTGPYLEGSYTRAKNLCDLGDVAWNEWGVGLGTMFNIGASSALVMELEYRWVLSHYDPLQEEKINGSRLQLNLGFVVYVY